MRGDESPSCPRCGYDLSGIVDSWQDSCPLSGICSECGLEYVWAELLNPMLTVPSWSYEHTLCQPSCRKVLPTIWHVLWPWSFWSRIKLTHPICRPQLLSLACFILVMVHIANAAAFSLQIYREATFATRWGPLANGATPKTLAWKAAIMPYWNVQIETNFEIEPSLQRSILFLGAWVIGTPLGYLLLGTSFARARVRKWHLLRIACYSMVLLPQFVVVLLIMLGVEWFYRWYDPFGDRYAMISLIAMIGIPTLFVTYWWFAIRNYLKLPHAFAVAFLMSLMSFLAIPVAAYLVHSTIGMFM